MIPFSINDAQKPQAPYSDYLSRSSMANSVTMSLYSSKLNPRRNASIYEITRHKLKDRRIRVAATSDERLAQLQSIINSTLEERPFKEIWRITRVLVDFIEKAAAHPNEGAPVTLMTFYSILTRQNLRLVFPSLTKGISRRTWIDTLPAMRLFSNELS